MAAQK
ncbi:hypothetical protein ECEC1870_1542, partial [Escherichia coli EC1870]